VKFTINHGGFGINCVPETVTVNVIDGVAGTPRTDYNAQVQLDTQSGFGTWAKTTGSGTFSDGTPNDGAATYNWPLGESQAVFTLYYPQGTPSLDVDVFQVSNTAIRDTDVEGPLVFSPNGFTVTAAPLSNPPGAITTFATNETAGTNFPLYLAAYGQTPSEPTCGIIEAYNGPKNLRFWSQYSNPNSGTRNVTIDGVSVATSEPASAVQNVVFANGQASVTAKYKDVGQIRVLMEDKTTTNPTDLPNGIQGGTANFVVKPYDFVLSAIQDSGGVANPQAANSSGPIFVHAGDAFRATVTVRDAEGATTPNYGRETPAENVRLVSALVDPVGGAVGAVTPTPNGFGAFVNGVATGTSFAWSEVGVMRLHGEIGDVDYLGAGNVVGPSVSPNVGRFVPHHFAIALNSPRFTTGCTAGGFTYQGQPLAYTTAPIITATAVSAGGSTTHNYTTAGYFKLTNSSLTGESYTSTNLSAVLSAAGVAPTPDPTIAYTANSGIATLTFGGGVSFVKGVAPLAPFAAGVQLAINVIDGDGVAAAPSATVAFPVIPFSAGDQIDYGRVRIANALGSELVDLPVKMVAEYYQSAAAGFVANASDVCTTGVSLSFSGYTKNLSPGETCVRDSGAPGASGVGCAAAAPAGLRFTELPSAVNPGDFGLRLAAPGVGNTGSVLINGNVPSWLKFDWNTGAPGDENPTGQATFGIYGGQSKQIYTREIY
jgi:MSHA biogenesis protein MshQ